MKPEPFLSHEDCLIVFLDPPWPLSDPDQTQEKLRFPENASGPNALEYYLVMEQPAVNSSSLTGVGREVRVRTGVTYHRLSSISSHHPSSPRPPVPLPRAPTKDMEKSPREMDEAHTSNPSTEGR